MPPLRFSVFLFPSKCPWRAPEKRCRVARNGIDHCTACGRRTGLGTGLPGSPAQYLPFGLLALPGGCPWAGVRPGCRVVCAPPWPVPSVGAPPGPRPTLQGVSSRCAKCAHFLYGRESLLGQTPPLRHTNEFCGKYFLADERQSAKSPPKATRRVYEEVGFEDRGKGGERCRTALRRQYGPPTHPLRPL